MARQQGASGRLTAVERAVVPSSDLAQDSISPPRFRWSRCQGGRLDHTPLPQASAEQPEHLKRKKMH